MKPCPCCAHPLDDHAQGACRHCICKVVLHDCDPATGSFEGNKAVEPHHCVRFVQRLKDEYAWDKALKESSPISSDPFADPTFH